MFNAKEYGKNMVNIKEDAVELKYKSYPYEDFYNSLLDAMKNRDSYDTVNLGTRCYMIGGSRTHLSVLPIPESQRINNLNNAINEDFAILRIEEDVKKSEKRTFGHHHLDHKNDYTLANTDFIDLLLESHEDYAVSDFFDILKYPENWKKDSSKIVLNEALRINRSKFSEGIRFLMSGKNDCNKYGKFPSNLHMKYTENNFHCCGKCGRKNTKAILFSEGDGIRNIIPSSTICLKCLPKFMSNYLEYKNQEKASSEIVSKII